MNLRCWLIVSLALNLLLAGALAWPAARGRARGASTVLVSALTNRQVRVREVRVESPPRAVEIAAKFHWGQVESPDYRVYLENLRAIGCPERTMRDIIVADVNQLFVERLRRVIAPMHSRFWVLTADLESAEEEGKRYETQWQALEEERDAVFQELLGNEDPFRADHDQLRADREQARWSRVLDFLPSEQRAAVLAVRAGFEEARRQLWDASRSLDKDQRAERQQQQRQLEAERDQQLEALLSPEQLAEYRLRTSRGAELCNQIRRVDFSEQELRVMAGIDNVYCEAESQVKGNTPDAKQQRAAIREQTQTALREALGEARYADYQRAVDSRFEQLCIVAERFGLPEERTLAVYEMQRQAKTQANLVRNDADRPPDQRVVLLEAIRAETERSLRTELGERPFAKYQERGGAHWLNALVAPPK